MSNIKRRLEKLERKVREAPVMVPDHGIDFFYGGETAVRYVTPAEYARLIENRTLEGFYKWLDESNGRVGAW